MSKRSNGEGSIYRRGDGRWGASVFVDTVSGQRKRIHVYGPTRQYVHDRLAEKLSQARSGIRTPDQEWTVSAYLEYWLAAVVAAKNRPRTAELYEGTVRLYLTPALGRIRLTKLTVHDVQTLLNTHLARGRSIRSVQQVRSVLRAALGRAEREELVTRNVAKLVELPAWERKPIRPWTAEEAARFLETAASHRLYAAFAMLLLYGMRRGEVLGLRWCDVDFADNQLHIRQQLQRIGPHLHQGPVKTAAGRRDLPLIGFLRNELARRYRALHGRDPEQYSGADPAAPDLGLVFLSAVGTPVDPKNFVRSFHDICGKANLPRITVHHTRHTAATMLKNLGVPARDAQLILGHSHITTTQQLYQHADTKRQEKALSQIEQQLCAAGVAVKTAANDDFSTGEGAISRAFTPGGPGGARTHDTLLKSLTFLEESIPATPVTALLHTRAYAHILGWVAVKKCGKPRASMIDTTANMAAWMSIRHALQRLRTQTVARRCFPLCLVPRSRHSERRPSPHDPQEGATL